MAKLFQSLDRLDPGPLKVLADRLIVLLDTKLWAKVLVGMILGIILGICLSASGPFSDTVERYQETVSSLMAWLALPAKLFLKIINMVIIPLIISSVIRGLASANNIEQMKSVGVRFLFFVLGNTIFASILGIFLTKLLQPGKGLNLVRTSGTAAPSSEAIFTIEPDKLLELVPSNPLSAIVEGQMFEVVLISIIGGIAFLSIDRKSAQGVIDALGVVQQICMNVISWAMRLAPFAVFGIMAQVSSSTGFRSLENMLYYVFCCFLGFATYLVFYAVLLKVVKKQPIFDFFKKILDPMLLAFSTSSSAATMPMTLKVAEEEFMITPSVARFLIPLGTTVNMAGVAIWHTTAVLFLGQVYQMELTLLEITFVVATSIASAIGSPGVPGVGVGILALVLARIGVPAEGIGLILGVDRIVDMGCTVVNVVGDLAASKLLDQKVQVIPPSQ